MIETRILSTHSSDGGRSLRLDFLDGIRGMAALGVVLMHLSSHEKFGVAELHQKLPSFFAAIWMPMRFGANGLAMFIAISGYCLMLPVARSADYTLRDGPINYLKRRARRILPPYYAAMILTLGMFYIAIPLLAEWFPKLFPSINEGETLLGFEWDSVFAHLLLIHNLKQEWNMQYNGPMWSLAIEWQIYFLLPILLLPLWKRFRNLAFLPIAFLVSLIPHYLLSKGMNFDWAKPWFLGLFATGMAGALIGFADISWTNRLRDRTPWLLIAAGLVGIWWLRWPEIPHQGEVDMWMKDAFAGTITTCILIHCARHVSQSPERNTSALVRFFEAPIILFFGSYSYSIYLIHYPVLHKVAVLLSRQHLSAMSYCVLLWCVSLPVILTLAYIFHIVFERPFLTSRSRRVA